MPIAPGTRVGNYEIQAPLGEGGMGAVYKAHDPKLQRTVAIKVLAKQDDDASVRLLQEARAASALNHPHICTIYEVGEATPSPQPSPPKGHREGAQSAAEGPVAFIVMEHVEGKPLSQLIPSDGLPPESVIRYSTQIADALAHAHEHGIVHRDLKSANVVITPEGRAKVLDFGLAARMPLADVEAATKTQEALPQAGAVVGTLAYMAPEMLRGEDATAQNDVWAIGVLTYEMASGQLPFAGATALELASAILNAPAPTRSSAVPRAFQDVIERCLAKPRGERYRTAREAFRALTELGASSPSPRQSEKRFTSLAVLPLKSLSRNPEDDFFADGLTEALISVLSGIKALRVISRTSVMRYRDTTTPLPEIARDLNVDAIVEGSVLHAGDRVRISTQLIDAARDDHLWAESYDHDLTDILKLQNEVASAIAREVRVALTPQEETRLAAAPQVDQAAHVAYLKGRFHLNKRAIQAAIQWFEAAIARDATYAPSHAGLAECLTILGTAGFVDVPKDIGVKAKAAARQAVQLDDTLAEAHTALGYAHFRFDWSWDEAEREFAQALDMNPRFATAQHYYAMLLILLGRDDDALNAVSTAIELDPLSPILLTAKGRILYFSRRFEEAITQLHAVLELEPEFAQAHFDLGMAYSQVGRDDPAVESLERAVSLSGRRPLFVGSLASVLGLAGRRDKIPGLLDELRAKGHATGVALTVIHIGLGDYERAVDAMEEAYRNREGPLLNMLLEPLVDPLRADPRFKHVVRQMGLPERSWLTSSPGSLNSQ